MYTLTTDHAGKFSSEITTVAFISIRPNWYTVSWLDAMQLQQRLMETEAQHLSVNWMAKHTHDFVPCTDFETVKYL